MGQLDQQESFFFYCYRCSPLFRDCVNELRLDYVDLSVQHFELHSNLRTSIRNGVHTTNPAPHPPSSRTRRHGKKATYFTVGLMDRIISSVQQMGIARLGWLGTCILYCTYLHRSIPEGLACVSRQASSPRH